MVERGQEWEIVRAEAMLLPLYGFTVSEHIFPHVSSLLIPDNTPRRHLLLPE